jgi:Transposase DDE domain
VLTSGDDYATAGKPPIDWDDVAAREVLIDSRARDGYALLRVLDCRRVAEPVAQAAALLATVLGQDLEAADDDVVRIARRVAADRVISTVDPQARHGHKTNHRGYDGFKGHIAIDADSEIITATTVSAPGISDAVTATDLLADILTDPPNASPAAGDRPVVYADAAYGTGELLTHLDEAVVEVKVKVQKPAAPDGHFTKDAFTIDLATATVTCPAGLTKPIHPIRGHDRQGRSVSAEGLSETSCHADLRAGTRACGSGCEMIR